MPKFSDTCVGGFQVQGVVVNAPPNPQCCSDAKLLCPRCARQALTLTGNSEPFDLEKAVDEWDDDDDRWDAVLNAFEEELEDLQEELDEEEFDDAEFADDDDEFEDEDDDGEDETLMNHARGILLTDEALFEDEQRVPVQSHLIPPEIDYEAWTDEQPVHNLATNNRRTDDVPGFEMPEWPAPTEAPTVLRNHFVANRGPVEQEHLTSPDADDYAAAFSRR